jgi:hypothetical protein
MVKTTYISNMIRIPTHGVDFSHQGLRFGERTQNRQWSHRKVSREGRKKEREREGSNILLRSHVMVVGTVVPPYMA